MAAIDLIVLGILKKQALSAYDIQKLVEYRHISEWVKISTPSIYKKVLQLEEKGLIQGLTMKEGKMPEKTVYSLTAQGEQEFQTLMLNIASKPIQIYLDFNAVIVNLEQLPLKERKKCLTAIEENMDEMIVYLETNLDLKEKEPDIPKTGMAVLHQQLVLAQTMKTWIQEISQNFI